MNGITAAFVKNTVLPKMKDIRVLVIGDIMLDQYWWGSVSRISPEAPIPVVEIKEQTIRLGGAANVANNIRSLGAKPLLLGIIGHDANGRHVLQAMRRGGLSTTAMVTDRSRPTTIKTRVIGHQQHIVRVDHESTARIDGPTEKRVLALVRRIVPRVDAVLLEDYNKGLFSPPLIGRIIALARALRKPVTVDPKFENFFAYAGATVFKPNVKEVEGALGRTVTLESLPGICAELIRRLRLAAVLITLGEKGMVYLERGKRMVHIPAMERKVHDVSGAGDTVIATLTACLAAGLDMHTTAVIANNAGGAVCEELGVVPVTPEMLLRSFAEN